MKIYTIEKGKHSINKRIPSFTFKSKLTFKVRFNETAKYDLGNVDQDDINKLYGFSDCWSLHHTNSARFGWRYNISSGMIELWAYTYTRTWRDYKLLASISINKEYKLSIECTENRYIFTIDKDEFLMLRKYSSTFSLRYRLFPYFGGQAKTIRTVTIELTEILNE